MTDMTAASSFDFGGFLDAYIADLEQALRNLPEQPVAALVGAVRAVWDAGGTVHFIGNGGSAGTPSHSAGDWAKELRLKVICHMDNAAALTAWANDTSYDNIFAAQLETFMAAGDLVVAYSGSGNSPNVIKGIEWASAHGAVTAAITGDYKGGAGGRLAGMVDIPIICETRSMERIEDLQLVINHIVKEALKAERGIVGSG